MKVQTAAGSVIDLGTTEAAPTIGITDYSKRVTDAFGVTRVVKRNFRRRMSVRLTLPMASVDAVQRQLAGLRASSALWTADDRYAWLKVQGFYKDFEVDLAVEPTSFCSLTVEGEAEGEVVADTGIDPAPPGQASSLRLLQPFSEPGLLVSSSVPENDHPEWSSTLNYAAGERVIKAATHSIYESVAAGNIGNDPATANGKWIKVGSTNRWAMFDEALGSSTTAAGSITVTLAAGTVNAIALLDVAATSVRVQSAAFDQTKAVGAGPVLFLDLPQTTGQVIVTIAGSGQVAVGTLLIGKLASLGVTEASPTAGITDYSRKDVDEFGEATIVERSWAKRMNTRAILRSDAVDVVANRIAAARATPSLWIGDSGLDSLTIYGFFRDFSIEVSEGVSKLTLSVEGLSKAATVLGTSKEELREQAALAAANAAAALAQLAVISADNILSKGEKPQIIRDWQAVFNEQPLYVAQADTLDVSSEDYSAKFSALRDYLIALTPAFTDTTADTPIDPAAFNGVWTNYYTARAALISSVTKGKDGAMGASNALANSGFDHPGDLALGWKGGFSTDSGLSVVGGVNLDANWSGKTNVGWTSLQGTPTASQFFDGLTLGNGETSQLERLKRWALPVLPGDRVFAACLLARHACDAAVLLRFWDGAGNDVTAATFPGGRNGGGNQGDPATFDRVGGFAEVPAGSTIRWATIVVRGIGIGVANPFIFYTQMHLCKVPATQTTWPDYVAGPRAGQNGRDGLDGTNGINGTNGQSVHIAYADSADGTLNFTTGEAGGRTFIGVYTDTNPGSDSTNPAAYGWTRLRGIDGTNGLAGPGGYVHLAYANSPDGTNDFDLSNPSGRTYLGVYTDNTLADSNNPATYSWSLIKGENGVSPITVELSATSINIAATSGGQTKTGQLPKTSTMTVKRGNTVLTSGFSLDIQYSSLAISASYANGVVSINQADANGWVDLVVTVAGESAITKRIAVSRTLDPTIPGSLSGANKSYNANSPASTTFATTPSTGTLIITTDANGRLVLSTNYDFTTAATTNQLIKAKGLFRLAGSGSAYSDFGAAENAAAPANGDPSNGSTGEGGFVQTLTGLSANTQYEVGMVFARVSGTGSTSSQVSGIFSVSTT